MIPNFILNNIINPIKREINNFKESLYKDLVPQQLNNDIYVGAINGNDFALYPIKKINIEANGNIYVRKANYEKVKEDNIEYYNMYENSLPVGVWHVDSNGDIMNDIISNAEIKPVQVRYNPDLYFCKEKGLILFKPGEGYDDETPAWQKNPDYKLICQIPVSIFPIENAEWCSPNYYNTSYEQCIGFKGNHNFDTIGTEYDSLISSNDKFTFVKMKKEIIGYENDVQLCRYEIDWDINAIYKQILNQ